MRYVSTIVLLAAFLCCLLGQKEEDDPKEGGNPMRYETQLAIVTIALTVSNAALLYSMYVYSH
jgi:hypothetical protein